jgi:putative ABC transport system permease protein
MSTILELMASAWTAVITHKLRSFLTILGVVIGVSAVIILMSIGSGTQASIVSRLESLGTNLLIVQPGSSTSGGVRGGAGSANTLTLEDAGYMFLDVPYIASVAPSYSTGMQIIYQNQNTRSQVVGVTLEYEQVYNLQLTQGVFFAQGQYDSAQKVVVLGPTVASTLFGSSNPVGQNIRLGSSVVTVIGVLQAKGQVFGSTDDQVLIPLTTLESIASQPLTPRGEHVISTAVISVTDKNYMTYVTDNVTTLLRYRHELSASASDDFTITSLDTIVSTVSSTTNSLTLLLGAIAGISLLVGGIGVMNIMLVSVAERRREIGIRKALGAREPDIWSQFLAESSFLTIFGGLIGIGVGWGGSYLINRFGVTETLVSATIVVLAVSVSVGIGVFFGFYPAWQASRLNPIEALRAE